MPMSRGSFDPSVPITPVVSNVTSVNCEEVALRDIGVAFVLLALCGCSGRAGLQGAPHHVGGSEAIMHVAFQGDAIPISLMCRLFQ